METMDIPCARCDEFKQRFEAAGFTVHGCKPAAAPEMCTLSYSAPGSAAMAAAVAATATAEAAPAASAAPITATQAATIKAIVNLFETSQVLGDYGKVTVLRNDTGRLTYGRSQTSLGSGNLAKLLRQYCANPGARFAAKLAPQLPRFDRQEAGLDTDKRVHNLLRACADDRVMRETQDQFFDEEYWAPAMRSARNAGVATPLGIAVVYDSKVHGSWNDVRKLTDDEAGTLQQLGEPAWISAYVNRRRQWLAENRNPLLRQTVYRMDAFRRLIDQGFWGLPLPLIVRDQEISPATLAGTPRGCYDGPQPGTRVIALADPVPRGLDVRLVQLALSDRGMDVMADGIFGQTSKTRITEYQIAHGKPATGVADLALIAELVG
jgi:chitosanase